MSSSQNQSKRASVSTVSSKKKQQSERISFNKNESDISDADSIASSIDDSANKHQTKNKLKNRRTINDSDDEDRIEKRKQKKKNISTDHVRLTERIDHPVALLRTSSPIVTATDLETRVSALEKELENLKNQVARMSISKGKHFKGPAFQLQTHHASNIGTFVRTEMFRAIKFMDAVTMRSQGQMIFQRALKAAKLENEEDNQEVYNVIISKVKHYLNVRKCHIIHDFRCAALGEYFNSMYHVITA
jgi:hypothetical protein